jgi:hypothetical protein
MSTVRGATVDQGHHDHLELRTTVLCKMGETFPLEGFRGINREVQITIASVKGQLTNQMHLVYPISQSDAY